MNLNCMFFKHGGGKTLFSVNPSQYKYCIDVKRGAVNV